MESLDGWVQHLDGILHLKTIQSFSKSVMQLCSPQLKNVTFK